MRLPAVGRYRTRKRGADDESGPKGLLCPRFKGAAYQETLSGWPFPWVMSCMWPASKSPNDSTPPVAQRTVYVNDLGVIAKAEVDAGIA